MCFSAQVTQKIRDYERLARATADIPQIEAVYQQRLEGAAIRIPRGFDRNFDEPASPAEKRIRDLIEAYREAQVPQLEQELFKQQRRLAGAERILKAKTTKKAQDDQRIATNKIGQLKGKLALLKGKQHHPGDDRIFPMTWSPIVICEGSKHVVRLARYHLRQPGKPASIDRKFPGLYNARRDNLERFWRQQFGQTHALMLVHSFFENVERDGANAVLHFTPRPAQIMIIACLYGEWAGKEGALQSFAAITDDPPAEVAAAGHDRMIINIQPGQIERWLHPEKESTETLQQILDDKQQPYYEHEVAA